MARRDAAIGDMACWHGQHGSVKWYQPNQTGHGMNEASLDVQGERKQTLMDWNAKMMRGGKRVKQAVQGWSSLVLN